MTNPGARILSATIITSRALHVMSLRQLTHRLRWTRPQGDGRVNHVLSDSNIKSFQDNMLWVPSVDLEHAVFYASNCLGTYSTEVRRESSSTTRICIHMLRRHRRPCSAGVGSQ